MKKTICAVTAAMLALTSVLCGCSNNAESSSQSGSTTSATVATDTTVKTTGEKIHINDSTLGEIWITELDGVPKNTLNNDSFSSDDTFKYYSENGKPASMEGIDISSYSGTIDWDKVKKSGVDFAMVRIGGRGYGSDGKMYSDDSALSYIKGAKAAGIKVGVYFFSQAVNNDEAIEEADYIKSLLGDETIDFPVAYVKRNRAMFAGIGIFALLFLVIAVSLGSCSASIEGAGSVIGITTYPSSDEDIYAAENQYAALESALNQQINEMERRHPNYDEYQYNIAEIGHNPYHLISYLTAKYGDWTYSDVENELQSLFEAQYHLNTEGRTETVTETRNVRVGESLGQVVTSGYCNCRICCGVWSGGPTASGAYPTANHTIAVDASNPFVPIGTKVVMNGVEYTVEDTGAFARYGVQFDVYYDNHAAASAHGHQTWEAYIADDNGSQEVTVTSTSTKKILYVTLANGSFDAVARANLNAEQLIIYNALNTTYGNRNYLWDVNNVTSGSGGNGMSYEIPPEALQDEEFARMIREAEKYLGVPYVWGGYSPSGFDCSGFVSYVINHCGNGWNYGRLTAEGLRGACTYVSPGEAKPGDLIFFQGTYNTSGASHVGIYVGNNMMIHCGDPIHYSNISTSYWQQHFMCFGRLP